MHSGNLLARDDTFLGICEAIGEDFGFHANWLRVALAVGTFFNPVAAIAAYLGMGVVVGLSRLLVPNPAPPAEEASVLEAEPVPVPAEAEAEPLPVAA
jgi:phage shock protein C